MPTCGYFKRPHSHTAWIGWRFKKHGGYTDRLDIEWGKWWFNLKLVQPMKWRTFADGHRERMI